MGNGMYKKTLGKKMAAKHKLKVIYATAEHYKQSNQKVIIFLKTMAVHWIT